MEADQVDERAIDATVKIIAPPELQDDAAKLLKHVFVNRENSAEYMVELCELTGKSENEIVNTLYDVSVEVGKNKFVEGV